MSEPKTIALVLAGAVAKGAFEAGVLREIAAANVRVARIVCASSGALNGAYYASAVRGRREKVGAEELVALWQDHARWTEVFHPHLIALLRGEGVSDSAKVRGILQDHIHPVTVADPAPINLRITVAPLAGAPGAIGTQPATTYEQMLEFEGETFDSVAALEQLFTAVVASSAFPGAFAPVNVPGVGLCIDGGMTNNTPIKYALDGALRHQIEAVLVISPVVEQLAPDSGDLRGTEMIGHLADMLINERLYRDLREAEGVNQTLAALDALSPGTLDANQLAAVKRAIGYEDVRQVSVIQIRPDRALPGGAFSGFLHPEQRAAYIQAGSDRARTVLRDAGLL